MPGRFLLSGTDPPDCRRCSGAFAYQPTPCPGGSLAGKDSSEASSSFVHLAGSVRMPVGPADLTLPSPLRTAAPSPGWWIFRLLLHILPASIAIPPSTAPPMAGPNTLLDRKNLVAGQGVSESVDLE